MKAARIAYLPMLIFDRPRINTCLDGLKKEAVPYQEREDIWRFVFMACPAKDLPEVHYRLIEILRNEVDPTIESVRDGLNYLVDSGLEKYMRDLMRAFDIILKAEFGTPDKLFMLALCMNDPFFQTNAVPWAKEEVEVLERRMSISRDIQFS